MQGSHTQKTSSIHSAGGWPRASTTGHRTGDGGEPCPPRALVRWLNPPAAMTCSGTPFVRGTGRGGDSTAPALTGLVAPSHLLLRPLPQSMTRAELWGRDAVACKADTVPTWPLTECLLVLGSRNSPVGASHGPQGPFPNLHQPQKRRTIDRLQESQ